MARAVCEAAALTAYRSDDVRDEVGEDVARRAARRRSAREGTRRRLYAAARAVLTSLETSPACQVRGANPFNMRCTCADFSKAFIVVKVFK